MEQLALAAYIIALASCALSLGAFYFLYASYRKPMLKSYILYLAAFSAQIALSLSGQAMALSRTAPITTELMAWLTLPNLFILSAYVYTVPRFYFDFIETPLPAGMNSVFRVFSIATILMAPLALVPARMAPLQYVPSMLGTVGFLSAMIYSQAAVIRAFPRIKERMYHVGVPVIIVYNILCTVGGIADSVVSQGQIRGGSYPRGMLFQPVMYTLWNALTFAWAVKAHGSGFFAGRSKRGIDAGKVAEYGLSEREAQLVRLVADGASNKEIGGELGISANTARNHVHNIFQKTGARNRVELVQRLWSGQDD